VGGLDEFAKRMISESLGQLLPIHGHFAAMFPKRNLPAPQSALKLNAWLLKKFRNISNSNPTLRHGQTLAHRPRIREEGNAALVAEVSVESSASQVLLSALRPMS